MHTTPTPSTSTTRVEYLSTSTGTRYLRTTVGAHVQMRDGGIVEYLEDLTISHLASAATLQHTT